MSTGAGQVDAVVIAAGQIVRVVARAHYKTGERKALRRGANGVVVGPVAVPGMAAYGRRCRDAWWSVRPLGCPNSNLRWLVHRDDLDTLETR